MATPTEAIGMPDALGPQALELWRAVDAAQLGTFDVDLVLARARLSDRARAMLGIPAAGPPETPHGELHERVHPEDRAIASDALERAIRREDGQYRATFRVIHADGSVHWVRARGRVFFDAPEPSSRRATRLMGVIVDVTEEQRAADALESERELMKQALRDIEERTALAVEAAQVGVYEWTPGSDRATWSDIMRRHYGASADEEITLARGLASLHPDDVEPTRRALAAALDPAGDGRFEIEQRVLHQGEVRWISSIGRVRFEERDGRRVPARLVGAAVEITARKNMEEAMREENRRKDEFLAMLGHELRNPLAPLQTACELMRFGELEPHQLIAMQEMIQRQVAHMTRLVDDLMDTARIRQGKLSLTRSPVELQPLLAAAIEAARSFTTPRHHHVELTAPNEPIWVEGDPVRLTQIVSNLLHNAVKFSADGGHIRVGLEHDGGEAVIRVSDDGKGIPAELLPHVFELFKQGTPTLQREKGGLGLGLALVRKLVQTHGGTVSAASDGPGKGAVFVVRLPRIEAPAARGSIEAAAGQGASRRVLLVDDNRDAAESLQLLLEMSGHRVKTAADGEEALALAPAWAPELLLIDIGLPGIDGYEVARRLRAHGSCRGAVLAALTGYGNAEDRQRSLEAGFDRHLVKPVRPDELLRLLRDLDSLQENVGSSMTASAGR